MEIKKIIDGLTLEEKARECDAAVQSGTAVVLHNGSPVEMPWIEIERYSRVPGTGFRLPTV